MMELYGVSGVELAGGQQRVERAVEQRRAVQLANRVGVVFGAQGQGEFQALVDPPLILRVQAHAPQSNRLGRARREALTVLHRVAVVQIAPRWT